MRHQHTIYYALLFFLITIIILMPWVDGRLFKHKYFHFIKVLNKDTRVHVDVLEYQGGWLNSYAKVRVTLVNSELTDHATTPLKFIIEENISHGPIIYDQIRNKIEFGYANIESDIHLAGPLEATLLGDQPDRGLMQLGMLAKFNDNWQGEIHIPSISLAIKDIGKISWNGLDGDFKIAMTDKHLKHITITIQIESVAIEDAVKNAYLSQVTITSSKYTYDGTHDKVGLWSGNTNFYLPILSVKTPDGSILVAEEVDINSSFSAAAKTFYNTNFVVNIKNIATPHQFISLFSKSHFMLSANYLSAENLDDYILLLRYMNTDEIKNINLKTIESLLIHTIIPTSYFDADASSDTSLGTFTSHSKISWKPKAPLPNTFSDIIENSYTVADIKASIPLITKILEIYGNLATASQKNDTAAKPEHPGELLHDLLLGGYLSKDSDSYSTTITVDNGVWKMNGRPIGAVRLNNSHTNKAHTK